MKKILLIIILIMAIFQLVVLATAIVIGNEASNRAGTLSTSATWIAKDGAADGTGTITTIEIWANSAMAGVEVATFFAVDATHFTTRDYETIQIAGQAAGVVPSGSKQTATVNLDVVTGDYIGIYWASGTIERGDPGNIRKLDGDKIPCDNQAELGGYTTIILSLKGIGATVEVGGNAIMMGINF